MANIFNADFREFIQILNEYNVEYILVGGYAVILHGYRRTTGDIDIWVNVTSENYERLLSSFLKFGLPTTDFSRQNFLNNDEVEVFTYGIPPVSIDILKRVKGCNFSDSYNLSQLYDEDSLQIRYLHLTSLIQSKKASGRFRDLDDLEKLQDIL